MLLSAVLVDALRAAFEDREKTFDLIALGHLASAQDILQDLLPRFREDGCPSSASYQNTRNKILAVAEPLLAGDRAAVAAILHGWEADNIRGTKIEPYWEPTPFPLETAPD